MMASPCERCGSSCSIISSTGLPALTMMMIERGALMAWMNSLRSALGMTLPSRPCSLAVVTNSSILDAVRL
ncbi:hypothetical protein D3C72_2449190 [compost metagenome]